MARRQYGLKFEDDFVKQLDESAAELGITRTALLELAAIRFMEDPVPIVDVQPGAPRSRPETRFAWVCLRCEKPFPRQFALSADARPRCALHGPMTRQENHPYRGEQT